MSPLEWPGLVTRGTEAAWDLISQDNLFRYAIGRCWNPDGSVFSVTAMNPSKARYDVNDPTLLKLVHFAKQEGHGSLLLRNLAAYSATDPAELDQQIRRGVDVVGEHNEAILMLDGIGLRVAAWGNFHNKRVRSYLLRSVCAVKSRPNLMVFGVNKSGEPKHPLYLKNSTRVVPLVPSRAAVAQLEGKGSEQLQPPLDQHGDE